MSFTIDSPTRYEYLDTREPKAAIRAVRAETEAITGLVRDAVGRQSVVPEPSGYRVTHVYQVADEEESEGMQYVELMDVETWEHIGPAVETLMTRTRADGWTVAITIVQMNLASAPVVEGERRSAPEK